MTGSEASEADGDATRAVFPFSVTVLKQLNTELRNSFKHVVSRVNLWIKAILGLTEPKLSCG